MRKKIKKKKERKRAGGVCSKKRELGWKAETQEQGPKTQKKKKERK